MVVIKRASCGVRIGFEAQFDRSVLEALFSLVSSKNQFLVWLISLLISYSVPAFSSLAKFSLLLAVSLWQCGENFDYPFNLFNGYWFIQVKSS